MLSHVRLFVTPWTVACQAPLSMGFSRQEYEWGAIAFTLDSILKSRDNLPTKVHVVKAMVFPVVMYGCVSWTIKKAECQRIELMLLNCGVGEDS